MQRMVPSVTVQQAVVQLHVKMKLLMMEAEVVGVGVGLPLLTTLT